MYVLLHDSAGSFLSKMRASETPPVSCWYGADARPTRAAASILVPSDRRHAVSGGQRKRPERNTIGKNRPPRIIESAPGVAVALCNLRPHCRPVRHVRSQRAREKRCGAPRDPGAHDDVGKIARHTASVGYPPPRPLPQPAVARRRQATSLNSPP